MLTITELNVYPVKGCKGLSVQQAKVHQTGFAFDRHWVIASQDKGRFQSQRSDPHMAKINVHLPHEALMGSDLPDSAALQLQAPGRPDLKIPLGASGRDGKPLTNVIVWDWHGQAQDEGDEAADWISSYLGKPLRLLRYAGNDSSVRSASPSVARAAEPTFAEGHETAFSDQLAYLVATQESLSDLNEHLKGNGQQAIPMDRFRPNITVGGCKPWEEDSWADLQMGQLDFNVALPCARCKVPTIDQDSGEVSKAREPTRTMQQFRKGTQLGFTRLGEWRANVFFGMQLTTHKEGILSVGDQVAASTRSDMAVFA